MQIILDITEEQAKYLKQFAENQHEGAHDNLGTHKPLHIVQTQVTHIVHDGGESGTKAYLYSWNEDRVFKSPEELVHAVLPELSSKWKGRDITPYEQALALGHIDNDSSCVTDEESYFLAYGIEDVQIVSLVHDWGNVSYHFTLAEAKKYKEDQWYNLNNPRTYTVGPGYSNYGDYEPLWDTLMQAGMEVIKNKDPQLSEVSVLVQGHSGAPFIVSVPVSLGDNMTSEEKLASMKAHAAAFVSSNLQAEKWTLIEPFSLEGSTETQG